MPRRFVLAAALLAAAVPASSAAQQSPAAGQLSFGLYGGMARGGTWFNAGGNDFRVGWAPAVGATAEMRLNESFGVRGNLTYMHTKLPESDDVEISEDRMINLFAYDVGVSFRPLARDPKPVLASGYVFAGVGGVTADVHGFEETECLPVAIYLANGACVPGGRRTKLQLNVGLGVDAARLTDRVTLFGEAALHGFSSPPVTCDDCAAEDKTALMPRVVVGVRFRAR
jgi:hypothetical protein